MGLLDNPVRTIASGQQAVAAAGTAEQLAPTPTPCSWVVISANAANTGDIYVGGSDVDSTNGVILLATSAPLVLPVADVSAVWVDSETNAEGVGFIYGTQ